MQLFYNPNIDISTTEFTFDKEESRHIIRVLRKQEGDNLHITNGRGILFLARIINASDKKCTINITSFEEKSKPWKYHLHIAIAPTKMNERYEWFLEKATEIGIDEITPIICGNSERKVIKQERMQKVIVTAMKQSLKLRLPKFNRPILFSEFIQNESKGVKFIAHCENTDKKTLNKQIESSKNIIILIGPEGDFTTKEITKALQYKFIPLSLGESRLRTETAGIVACNTISILKSNS